MQKSKSREQKPGTLYPWDKSVQDKLERLKADYKELETKKIQHRYQHQDPGSRTGKAPGRSPGKLWHQRPR